MGLQKQLFLQSELTISELLIFGIMNNNYGIKLNTDRSYLMDSAQSIRDNLRWSFLASSKIWRAASSLNDRCLFLNRSLFFLLALSFAISEKTFNRLPLIPNP